MLQATMRRLMRITTGYSISTLVGPLFTIVLTPIYTRVLTTGDYGTVDTLMMLSSALTMLGALGLPAALPAFYYDPQRQARQRQILASAIWVSGGWSLVLAGGVFVGAAQMTQLTLNRTDVADLLAWLAIGLPFAVIYQLQMAILRLRFAVWRANLLALLYLLIFAGANLILIVWLRRGSTGVILAHTVTMVSMGLLAIALAPESIRGKPRFDLMRGLARTGALLVPGSMAAWVLMYQDRLFLVRYVSLEQIGVYAIAVRLASVLSLLVEPFKAAWGPLALSIQQQHTAPQSYTRVFLYYCVGGLGLALALSLLAPEILFIVTTPAYIGASAYVWLLTLMSLTSGLQTIMAVGLYIAKQVGHLGWTVVVAAGLNTVLNLLLIPHLGVMGAVIATAIGYLAAPLLTAVVAQRWHPLPYQWGKALLVFLIYLVLAGAGQLFAHPVSPSALAVRLALLLSYLPLLGVFGIFEAHERHLFFHALRHPRMVWCWMMGRV